MDKGICQRVRSDNGLAAISEMKYVSEEFRIITNGWPIQFDGLTEGETRVFFKYINNLNTIGRWWRTLVARLIWVLCVPLFLFLLRDQLDGIVNGVGGTPMSGPGIGNQEQNGALLSIYHKIDSLRT